MLTLSLGQWVVVCLLSGFVAATLMNIPMGVQPEGYLPAYVAAGGLTDTDPTEVSQVLAVAVHQVTGTVATLLYGGIVFVLSLVLPTVVSLNGVPAIPHLVGVTGLVLFIFLFFDRIAMPRAGGRLQDDRDRIVRQWALSSFIYGVAVALLVPVLVDLFAW
ncbi:hypothetical protein ACFQJ5_00385 [Halomicroarcula sp. GCM10025324]|uniref:hypothetical protein n=1 Tax=Haloarcula TaxID=2237 RepID=UPI0023E8C41B|nr:hypothetical protein [Halomicroarcula sp. ZS-22-S1]